MDSFIHESGRFFFLCTPTHLHPTTPPHTIFSSRRLWWVYWKLVMIWQGVSMTKNKTVFSSLSELIHTHAFIPPHLPPPPKKKKKTKTKPPIWKGSYCRRRSNNERSSVVGVQAGPYQSSRSSNNILSRVRRLPKGAKVHEFSSRECALYCRVRTR